jgi:hypothetical protein
MGLSIRWIGGYYGNQGIRLFVQFGGFEETTPRWEAGSLGMRRVSWMILDCWLQRFSGGVEIRSFASVSLSGAGMGSRASGGVPG